MDRRGVWVSGGLMAALGLLLGLREAGARLSELHARVAAFGSGPVPRSLDWIAGTAPMHRLLAALEVPITLAALLVCLAVAWRLARLLNPHGTLLAAEAPEGGVFASRLQTPLDAGRLRRLFAAAAITFYLVGGVRLIVYGGGEDAPPIAWGLTGLAMLTPESPFPLLVAAFALGGAAIWFLLGEWLAPPIQERRIAGLVDTVGCGAIVGACAAFLVLYPLTAFGRADLNAYLSTIGLADSREWRWAVLGGIFFLPAAFLLIGILVHLQPRLGVRNSFGCFTPFVFLGMLFLVTNPQKEFGYGLANRLRHRYDHGGDLAALINAKRQPSSTRAYLIFPRPDRALFGFVPYMSIEGIDAGDGSPRKTWAYLERREYRTALAWNAFVHLHDCASLDWDSDRSLRVDLANLEHHPQPAFARLLVEKLSTCATSEQNRRYLQQAAEPQRFRASPDWLRTLGLLHRRFGDMAAAEAELRDAGMAEAEIATLMAAGPPLTTGRITGRLLVNGQPGAGLTAGLLPADRWSSLVGTPRPFEHRWVAAAAPVDAEGRFALQDLGEGSYVLIVAGDAARFPVHTAGVRVESTAGEVRLDRRHRMQDLGTIRVMLESPAPPSRDGVTQEKAHDKGSRRASWPFPGG